MAKKHTSRPDAPSTTKGIFNVAAQTMRPELIDTITEPMTLSVEETKSLLRDLIGLKQDAAEWKEKWQQRKELMDNWFESALAAQDAIRKIVSTNTRPE